MEEMVSLPSLVMLSPPLTSALEAFLQQPDIEASPAWELLHGQAHRKPMPTLFHSRLQRNLVNTINAETRDYEAIQELRCVVPPLSPVPDIVVVRRDRLPQADGPFPGAPDWLIEIRSPDQSILHLQSKILHCLLAGTELAWLIDWQRQQIWVWTDQDLPLVYGPGEALPTLGMGTPLTVTTVLALTQA